MNMQKLIDIVEELGWKACIDKCREEDPYNGRTDYDIELSQYSPAGEDFCISFTFDGTIEELAKEVRDYADTFDEEDHVMMWLGAKKTGMSGVPSAKELVEDAEAIQKMLDELADKLM